MPVAHELLCSPNSYVSLLFSSSLGNRAGKTCFSSPLPCTFPHHSFASHCCLLLGGSNLHRNEFSRAHAAIYYQSSKKQSHEEDYIHY